MERPFVRNSGNIVEPIGYNHLRPKRLTGNKSSQTSMAINYYWRLKSAQNRESLHISLKPTAANSSLCIQGR